MMRGLIAGLIVLCAASASAQTGTPTSYMLRVYAKGAATPTTTLSVTVAQVMCNQATAGGVGVENPTTWRWDDRAVTGRQCIFADATRMMALPDGAYEGTVAAVNADGSSAESARVPFTRRRGNLPPVPTGLSFSP